MKKTKTGWQNKPIEPMKTAKFNKISNLVKQLGEQMKELNLQTQKIK